MLIIQEVSRVHGVTITMTNSPVISSPAAHQASAGRACDLSSRLSSFPPAQPGGRPSPLAPPSRHTWHPRLLCTAIARIADIVLAYEGKDLTPFPLLDDPCEPTLRLRRRGAIGEFGAGIGHFAGENHVIREGSPFSHTWSSPSIQLMVSRSLLSRSPYLV